MAKRQKLLDDQLDSVAGGVSYNNEAGDHSVYVIGKNGCAATHTFKKADKAAVLAIINATDNPNIPIDENEENIMAALIASPYLTAIS